MDILAGFWIAARDFFERGGVVLLVLGLIIFAMWALILSRWLYLQKEYRADISPIVEHWIRWKEQDSALWARLKVEAFNSVAYRLNRGLPLIRTLAGVCPLLGLLGTVVGMITIFQVMGSVGSGSPRIVAAGVSTAMVTTMAGMVGALSGVFPAHMLARRARTHLQALQSADRKPEGFKEFVGRKRPLRFKRYLMAPAAAFLFTFLLVFGMEQMILIGRIALIDPGNRFAVDFVRVERNETLTRKEKPDKPPEPVEQPNMAEPQAISNFATAIRVVAVAPPVTVNSGTSVSGLGFVATDGEFLPIVKVAPIYPPRAAVRGLEGYVIVEYTVTASGDTKDVVVIESTSSIFNNYAIDSALKYKYRPRIIDGTPVDVVGITTMIIFELDELEDED